MSDSSPILYPLPHVNVAEFPQPLITQRRRLVQSIIYREGRKSHNFTLRCQILHLYNPEKVDQAKCRIRTLNAVAIMMRLRGFTST